MIVTIYVFTYFGGFTTGKSLDVNEFKAYAKSVDQISTPQEYNIIALGEATHGNKEFQQLKLEVFKKLVEEHRVHSFALEGDFGGCEEVNQYRRSESIYSWWRRNTERNCSKDWFSNLQNRRNDAID